MAKSPSVLPSMKTARFSQVVSKCGKPEVYLLLTKNDPAFRKALAEGRILMIPGGERGSKPDYGLVGYDEKKRGQLLLFPKSLKKFEAMKVVGIKWDLLSGQGDQDDRKPPVHHLKKTEKPKAEAPAKIDSSPPRAKKSKAVKSKVIEFPKKPSADNEPKIDELNELRASARSALKSLEKGNSVAAYNFLKKIVR